MSNKHRNRIENANLDVVNETEVVEEVVVNEPELVVTDDEVFAGIPVVEEVEPEESKPIVRGVVVDCWRLNVRETPARDGKILTQIDQSTEVIVDEDASTDEFYKVCLATGLEGYCAKQFVKMEN